MTYTYRRTESNLWTVGTQEESGWLPESDHDSEDAAIARLRWLNGAPFVLTPDAKETYVPTRFDRLLEAAFTGIMGSPGCADLTQSEVAEWAIGYTKALVAQLDEEGL